MSSGPPHNPGPEPAQPAPHGPRPPQGSRLYRAELWRLGMAAATGLPVALLRALAVGLAATYWQLARKRRRAVVSNLLPAVGNDPARAREVARRLYRNFALKLVDLWRYEAGVDIQDRFGELLGADLFSSAVGSGRGVLLLTPHLGNWEFGAPLLARHGIRLLALTLAEPHAPLTRLRSEARARHGIETLVIQQDPFAFLEVIRRLERGQVVALLVDRPPEAVAVPVELFGRRILASVAPAELARASGCILLPVCVTQNASGRYDAGVLPPVPYERPALRDPSERKRLAQAIFHAFEPTIRNHADQWYHFVPVWEQDSPRRPPDGRSVPSE